MNLGIYVYDDVEVMDFAGPFEVFSVANRLSPDPKPFSVLLIGERPHFTARGGLVAEAQATFDTHPALDVLIVPGGVHGPELAKPQVIDWIGRTAQGARQVASVCTGAFLLAEAGVLTRETVTTHWEDMDDLRAAYPALDVVGGVRWVDAGIVTSAGISAGST